VWALDCVGCKDKFNQTKINDSKMMEHFLPTKLCFPAEGVEMKCPNCGHTSVYKTNDFAYQA
jgi:hypothetical protein